MPRIAGNDLCQGLIIGLLRGGPRGGGSLIFPKLPQCSRAGILRLPQEHPLPFKNPTILSWCRALVFFVLGGSSYDL